MEEVVVVMMMMMTTTTRSRPGSSLWVRQVPLHCHDRPGEEGGGGGW